MTRSAVAERAARELARLVAMLACVAAGCARSGSVESQSDTPVAVSVARAPRVAVSPSAGSPPARSTRPDTSEHRVHGAIEGRFVPAGNAFVVGEPIVIRFEVRPTAGPLRMFVGGDGRNEAAYPMRVAVKAVDVASGATVCDNVESPPFPSFGGVGSEQTFGKGQWQREAFVLNPACPGLARPGTYRVTLHRRITDLDLKVEKPGAKYPTSCDVHPIHEGPAPDVGVPECGKLLDALPWVTSVIELRILPFDAALLRRAVERNLRDTSDETMRQRIALWLCGWIGCSCSKTGTPSDAEVVAALPSALPKSFPGECP